MTDEQAQHIIHLLNELCKRLEEVEHNQNNTIEALLSALIEIKPSSPEAIDRLLENVKDRKQ